MTHTRSAMIIYISRISLLLILLTFATILATCSPPEKPEEQIDLVALKAEATLRFNKFCGTRDCTKLPTGYHVQVSEDQAAYFPLALAWLNPSLNSTYVEIVQRTNRGDDSRGRFFEFLEDGTLNRMVRTNIRWGPGRCCSRFSSRYPVVGADEVEQLVFLVVKVTTVNDSARRIIRRNEERALARAAAHSIAPDDLIGGHFVARPEKIKRDTVYDSLEPLFFGQKVSLRCSISGSFRCKFDIAIEEPYELQISLTGWYPTGCYDNKSGNVQTPRCKGSSREDLALRMDDYAAQFKTLEKYIATIMTHPDAYEELSQ